MPHPRTGTEAARTVPFCYLLFALTGAAALVYEISWSRQVGLLFGHTVHAAAVVLTSYFAGLAAGYGLGARVAASVHPLRAYAVAEFTAAGWACLVPVLLAAAESSPASPLLQSASPGVQLAARWLFCFLLLLPATAALGATLPLMAEWLSPARRAAIGRMATAYAFNTGGALVGVVAATAWLLVGVGVRGSSYATAAVSAACGGAALLLSWRVREGVTAEPPDPSSRSRVHGSASSWWLLPAAVSGFGVLALEVLYARMFSLVFHNSTYTFGAVLAAVLLGLALGPMLVRSAGRALGPHAILASAAWAGAAAVALSVSAFARITRLEYFEFGAGFASYLLGAFGLAALVALPPAALLGAILPAAWYGLGSAGGGAGKLVGPTAVVNALAGAAGAACASLVLLPLLGLWGSFVAVASLFALLACGVLVARRRRVAAVLCGLGFLAALAPVVAPAGPERWARTRDGEILVRRWDSAYGWIDVVKDRDSGAFKVRQNLHYRFGTTGADAPRAYRQAHLPLLLHPRPSDVLFLGLGTGLTAAGAIPHPEVERAVVVELVPEVVEAARLLAGSNFGVVDDPRFEVRIDDARHYLLTADRRFDVIISDLFVPWESEAGYLYTVEHYRAARRRLNSGGLFCQWLAVYQLGPRELELIADSFASVFPETSLWWGHVSPHRAIVALVGGDGPVTIDGPEVDRRLARLREVFPADDEIRTSRGVYELHLGQWRPQRREALNTDEHPRVEFLSPVSQRDQTLLQGMGLRRYYDDVLAGLPEAGVRLDGDQAKQPHQRGWHRLALFPD